MSMTEVWSLL